MTSPIGFFKRHGKTHPIMPRTTTRVVRLYHGTTRRAARQIIRSELRRVGSSNIGGNPESITNRKDVAKDFAGEDVQKFEGEAFHSPSKITRENKAVIEIRLPKDLVPEFLEPHHHKGGTTEITINNRQVPVTVPEETRFVIKKPIPAKYLRIIK